MGLRAPCCGPEVIRTSSTSKESLNNSTSRWSSWSLSWGVRPGSFPHTLAGQAKPLPSGMVLPNAGFTRDDPPPEKATRECQCGRHLRHSMQQASDEKPHHARPILPKPSVVTQGVGGAPGAHAHGNTKRQVVDGLRTEVCGQQKQSNDPHNNQHNPQYANCWAPLTRKRYIPPHSAQPQHTNHWALRTRQRHQQEHRLQRPTERSDPTQHAKGRMGDCPGPRKETTTRRTVTREGGGGLAGCQFGLGNLAFRFGRHISRAKPRGFLLRPPIPLCFAGSMSHSLFLPPNAPRPVKDHCLCLCLFQSSSRHLLPASQS